MLAIDVLEVDRDNYNVLTSRPSGQARGAAAKAGREGACGGYGVIFLRGSRFSKSRYRR
jgi:hypothetical protein